MKTPPKETDVEDYYPVDWWIEFLEGELDPSMERDMAMLLANSKADAETFRTLAATRELVKDSTENLVPEDGHYFNALHAKIMNGLRDEKDRFATATGAKAEAEAREELRRKWVTESAKQNRSNGRL